MTLKSFLSTKKYFSAWERIFCTGIFIIGLFPLGLYTHVLWFKLIRRAIFLALQHFIRTYLWTLVQNCGLTRFSGADCRSVLSIGMGYFAIFNPFPSLKGWSRTDSNYWLIFSFRYTLFFWPNYQFIG